MKWTNPGHEFDEVAKIICDENNKFYLWGAGNGCREFIRDFGESINIEGIFDSNKKRVGEVFEGFPIVESENLNDKKVIVTTSDYYKELIDFLEESGLQKNKSYFLKKDFSAIYHLYKNNILELDWMNLIVTDKCTLKCKDCIMFAPYFKNPKHQTVKSLKKEVDLAFNVWKHIKSYQIVGGEPLIFPYLEEIIEYIGENYRKQIGEFLITTNGTVLPEESFFKKCAKYDMTIRISDYSVSKKFFKKQKVAEWKENLERFNIKHELFGTGIWHDFGNPNAKMIHSKEELINLYQNCDCVHSTIRDGKWYTCCRQAAAVWSGQVEEKEDFFDLKSNTENKQAILEFYLKFCKKGWLSCCEACFGDGTIMMNREVDAAEQLE